MVEFSRRGINIALIASALALARRPHGVIRLASAAPLCPLFNFAIAGGYHHGLRAVLLELKPGMVLDVRREADNPYDDHAIAVHAPDGMRLGYIPRGANAPVATLMDAGRMIRAEIVTMLAARCVKDIPDDLVFTDFTTGDPVINLAVL